MHILVTGGAGYIGSHTCVDLLENNYQVTIVDNLSNSKETAVKRIEEITGKTVNFIKCDILDEAKLNLIFTENTFEAVIHFAGLKAVGESVEIPLDYYKNNISGTLTLCSVMKKHNVKNLIFSSSATVYGLNQDVPFKEDYPLSATNPYGRSKLMIEEILTDLYNSDNSWNIVLLRYFNPVGAHDSGLIGEDPNGIPNNLMPFISQIAVGKLKQLKVFGDDYPTKDGTGVRDYIHVVDLAGGHIKAIDQLSSKCGLKIYNLGCGHGYSVLEVIAAFQKESRQEIPYEIVERRTGDIAVSYADASLAKEELKWETTKDIADMCRDSWNWQQKNPEGYDS
jgi:UDP-glucose 4-epimerase